MKQKLSLVAIILLLAGNATFAQVTANTTAAAYAKLIAPIAISKVADLQFGDIVGGAGGGTVVMPNNSDTRSVTGACTLPTTSSTAINRAQFTVTGEAGYSYSITLPADGVVVISNGTGGSMGVNSFSCSPASPTTIGSGDVYVGATLVVGAAQAAGSYSTALAGGSGAFTVTVNYN